MPPVLQRTLGRSAASFSVADSDRAHLTNSERGPALPPISQLRPPTPSLNDSLGASDADLRTSSRDFSRRYSRWVEISGEAVPIEVRRHPP